MTLAAPTFGADFSQVVDQVTFQIGPEDRDLIIYVGFDDGKPPKKPSETEPDRLIDSHRRPALDLQR